MLVKILGCGTSTGVPIPGCTCSVCSSSDPRNARMRTSALVTLDSGKNILIDTSTDLRHQVLKWNVTHIDAVLFTHFHSDHILGLDDLRGFNFVQQGPIPCFGTRKTLEELERIFPYAFKSPHDYQGGLLVQLDFHEISPPQPFTVFETEIIPFSLMHGNLPVTGFRIGPFAYATDCNHIPEASKHILRGVPYLILDALRSEPHATHFSIPQAIQTAQEIGASMTYLTHMTHSVDYESEVVRLPSGVTLAYDGLEINLAKA